MKGKDKLQRISSATFVFLFLAIPGVGQSMLSSDDRPLLEVVHTYSLTAECRNAIHSDGKLVLVDVVIPPGREPDFGKFIDLNM